MATKVSELKKRATMINDKVRMYLLPPLINAAVRAGASIMNVYKNLTKNHPAGDSRDYRLQTQGASVSTVRQMLLCSHRTIHSYRNSQPLTTSDCGTPEAGKQS